MSSVPAWLLARRTRTWAWWLLPALALGALIGWEIDWGRHVLRLPAEPAPVAPKPVDSDVLPEYRLEGGITAHSETVNRTLFNPTRRPAPVLAADDARGRRIQRGQFQLVGTAVTGVRNIAFLKEAGGKARAVRQGDEINGMKVALVAPDRVKLTAGDETEELFLKVAPGPKTTTAAAPVAPPPAVTPGAPQPAAAPPPGVAARPAVGNLPMPNASQQARRAARAAAAAAAAASRDSTLGGAAPATPATPAPADKGAQAAPDTSWDAVYRGMQRGAAQ